jgi:LytS/YehU family sensor histidine kinase
VILRSIESRTTDGLIRSGWRGWIWLYAAWSIPALILKPLVENSIRHGVAQKEGTTRLVIRARRNNGSLKLQVDDSGPGFSHESDASENGGVGLTNVRKRLQTKYGDRAKLAVLQSDTGGASVELTIPLDDSPIGADTL